MEKIRLETPLFNLVGNNRDNSYEYLGIEYAKAKRFEYASEITKYDRDKDIDCTEYGAACPQYREFFPHLDVPERMFYHKEFRDGLKFVYDEDRCLNLNVYTPKEEGKYPVVIYIHGGGFNSMCNSESYLDGDSYAKRGVILVVINYRVGVFGYLTNKEIQEKYGRNGNFGLDDILTAIKWVKHNIHYFGGDSDNITLMGQSAGAMQVQWLSLSDKAEGLYNRAIMMSGAGSLPSFASPKRSEDTMEYWDQVISLSGVKTFDEFKALPVKDVLSAVEEIKKIRKDNQRNTMCTIDGYILTDEIKNLISKPHKIDYLAGVTSCDMFSIIFANMAYKFIKKNNGYIYLFDVDAPGDKNKAFHSSDLRYVFGTLDKSWRPYDEKDKEISETMLDYFTSFIKTGDPNGGDRPLWKRGKVALRISKKGIKMKGSPTFKLLKNTFAGDPK